MAALNIDADDDKWPWSDKTMDASKEEMLLTWVSW